MMHRSCMVTTPTTVHPPFIAAQSHTKQTNVDVTLPITLVMRDNKRQHLTGACAAGPQTRKVLIPTVGGVHKSATGVVMAGVGVDRRR